MKKFFIFLLVLVLISVSVLGSENDTIKELKEIKSELIDIKESNYKIMTESIETKKSINDLINITKEDKTTATNYSDSYIPLLTVIVVLLVTSLNNYFQFSMDNEEKRKFATYTCLINFFLILPLLILLLWIPFQFPLILFLILMIVMGVIYLILLGIFIYQRYRFNINRQSIEKQSLEILKEIKEELTQIKNSFLNSKKPEKKENQNPKPKKRGKNEKK